MTGPVCELSDAGKVVLDPQCSVSKHLVHTALHSEWCSPKGERMQWKFPVDGVLDLAARSVDWKKPVLMVPFSKRTLFHHVVKDLTGDDAVMPCHPHWAQRTQTNAESSGCVVNQRTCFYWLNAFPFWHDASESTWAVVPSPNIFDRRVVCGEVFVGWHGMTSLMSRVVRGA